jgi:hypothetical protein
MADTVMHKIKNLQPLTDTEMEDAVMDQLVLLAQDKIFVKEFVKRITIIGSLVDLDEGSEI